MLSRPNVGIGKIVFRNSSDGCGLRTLFTLHSQQIFLTEQMEQKICRVLFFFLLDVRHNVNRGHKIGKDHLTLCLLAISSYYHYFGLL